MNKHMDHTASAVWFYCRNCGWEFRATSPKCPMCPRVTP